MIAPNTARVVSSILFLALLAGCEAPEVVPREPALVQGGGVAAGGPRAEQLKQVEERKAELEGLENPVGILASLGSLYYENGRYPEAIDWYRQAIEKAAPALEAFDALAGEVGDREPYAGELPGICASRAEAKGFERSVNVAEGLRREGPPERALACYRAALQPVAAAYARRGSSWAVLEQVERGLADIDRALQIAPDMAEANFLYGAVVFNNRQGGPGKSVGEKAVKAWQHFLELAPDHPRAAQVRGALDSMMNLSGLPAGHPPMDAAAAAAARQGGKVPGGAPQGSAEPAPALVAGLPPALVEVVKLLMKGRPADAIAICDQFLAMAPAHGAAMSLKAQALAGDEARAKEAMELAAAALDLGPNARAQQVLGTLHERRGDLEAAGNHYREAQKADPAYATAAGVDARLERLAGGK
ncbi:MAG: tetratricopeptide repeat protein [Deltaproteobacteria bacterium]|nr:tetratricopeptide repeat protein [Deltaproteobacteria bacterium]